MNPSGMPFWKISPCSMMGVWCFCFEMGWRLRCEKSSNVINLKRLLNGKQNVWKYQNGEEKSDSDGREKDV